jgi:hypothetical protein
MSSSGLCSMMLKVKCGASIGGSNDSSIFELGEIDT